MKKLIVISLFVVFCLTPLAVLAKHNAVDMGSLELGVGSIAVFTYYVGNNYEQRSVFGLGLTPNLTIGYFFIDRLMIGASCGYYRYKSESMDEAYIDFDIEPLFKYYFPVSAKFLINIKGFFGIYREKDMDYPDYNWTQPRFGGGVAATYLIIPQLGCNIGIDSAYFSNWRYDGETLEESSDLAFRFVLGLNVYL
jgi:hypothetical protein